MISTAPSDRSDSTEFPAHLSPLVGRVALQLSLFVGCAFLALLAGCHHGRHLQDYEDLPALAQWAQAKLKALGGHKKSSNADDGAALFSEISTRTTNR